MTRPQPATLDIVRQAVRGVIERTGGLADRPELRRRIARNMVGVSLAAAELLDAERRFDAAASPAQRGAPQRASKPVAAAQAAGDFHRRTAVNSAADVLQATRRALDFPAFVTSLISGVFQAMTTSTIQQLEAYANLLEAVNTSASSFAASSITPGRAATWAAGKFPELEITGDDPPALVVREDAELPDAAVFQRDLEASADEVSAIDEDDLESTLLPLVSRKLARDRQSMLATMVLMGMNRIVVDSGRIHASMELQVDARSTAEQVQAERFDTRVTTSASGSFGMGMWGASASMSASVGYVKSDEQFSREDIALRAGLRSSVDIGFHTEPLNLKRMAPQRTIDEIQTRSRVPEVESLLAAEPSGSLLTPDQRQIKRPTFDALPELPQAPDPGSQEQRDLRARKDFGPPEDADESADSAAQPADAAADAAPTDAAAESSTDAAADAAPTDAATDAPAEG